jgi:hypothetical protein
LGTLLDTGLTRPLTRTIRWIVWFKLTNVDRCGNTIRCVGNAVTLHFWLFRVAHHQYSNIGPPPDSKESYWCRPPARG